MTAKSRRPGLWRRATRPLRRVRLLRRAGRRLRRRIQPALADLLANVQRGEHTFVVLVAIGIGILAAYGAIGFRYLIFFAQELFYPAGASLDALSAAPWWQRLLAPAAGGLVVGLLVTRMAPEVRGSGIPEVMEAVARRAGAIRLRVVLTKAVAVALTIGSGGSAGREGPIVHIGSAIGSGVGQLLQVSAERVRTFVACGAAAGIAATFNAPIAGALFAMEVVVGEIGVGRLSPVVISSVVAVVLSRHHLGDFPAFEVPAYEAVSPMELLFYGLLGILAAGVAVGFIRVFYASQDLFEKLDVPEWVRPGVGGLGVGLLALVLPQVGGVGYETINAALEDRVVLWLILPLLVAKLLATALTLGSGASGGIFAPSLFAGAMLGAAVGGLVHGAYPTWTAHPGAYALVGMGALVAGTTHAPITAILIIFELTNDYHIIPPLMLSCVVSVLLSRLWHRESIYTAALLRRGVRLEERPDPNVLRGLRVSELMLANPPKAPAQWPLSQVVSHLLASRHAELFVVDRLGTLLGTIGLGEIKDILTEVDQLGTLVIAADVMLEDPAFVTPEENLGLAMHLVGRIDRHAIPVCADAESRILVGMVTRDQLIDTYNRRVFETDLSGGFSSLIEAGQERSVEVLGGIHLEQVEVPFALVGMTLREADLRRRYDVEVMLIRTAGSAADLDGRPGRVRPDVRLEAGDRLLVMGTPEAIAALRR